MGPSAARPVLLSDLTRDLQWPRMLRSATMAMRPQRWIFSTIALVLVLLIVRGADQTAGGRAWCTAVGVAAERARDEIGLEVRRHDLGALAGAIGRGLRALVIDVPSARPLTTLAICLPIVVLWSVGGTSVARMTAVEFGQGVVVPWPEALRFGVRRWRGAAGALLVAPVAAGMIALGLAIGGWLLLNWPVVQIGGSIVYPVFMLVAMLAVVLLVGTALGHHLFCPAVACEGADWLDAFQRAMAYLVASPGRLLLYTGIGVAQTVVVGGLVWMVGAWTGSLTTWATSAWLRTSGPGEAGAWGSGVAEGLVALWHDIPALLVGGLVVSAYFASSTVAYLLLREHNDGQDPADLWMEGLIDGTLAPVEAGAGGASTAFDEGDEG